MQVRDTLSSPLLFLSSLPPSLSNPLFAAVSLSFPPFLLFFLLVSFASLTRGGTTSDEKRWCTWFFTAIFIFYFQSFAFLCLLLPFVYFCFRLVRSFVFVCLLTWSRKNRFLFLVRQLVWVFCNNFYSFTTFAFIAVLFFFFFFRFSFVDFCRRMILIVEVSRVIRKGWMNGFFFLYRQRVRMFYNNFYPSPSFVFLSVLFYFALRSLSFVVGWFLSFLVQVFRLACLGISWHFLLFFYLGFSIRW